jgi:hypothetical protein
VSCKIPEKTGAGLTFSRLLTLTAYPAPDWTVTLLLRGPAAIDLTAVAEGTQHRILETAAVTADWTPGNYWYSLRVTDGTTTEEYETGQITITPDLAAETGVYDGRTTAEIALEAIEAVIAKRATLDQERYRINNRELFRTPISDLILLRNEYRRQVRNEKGVACGRNPFGAVVRVRLQ